jgi:hypothetical protein
VRVLASVLSGRCWYVLSVDGGTSALDPPGLGVLPVPVIYRWS